jgi:hypothetical protein
LVLETEVSKIVSAEGKRGLVVPADSAEALFGIAHRLGGSIERTRLSPGGKPHACLSRRCLQLPPHNHDLLLSPKSAPDSKDERQLPTACSQRAPENGLS